jgi:hypothetical protein
MKLTFNSIDIFDMVVDEQLGPQQLEEIANAMYLQRRGGELSHLWESQEFTQSLAAQLDLFNL